WAQWALASSGYVDGWTALLQSELEGPAEFVGFAQDAARRLGESELDPPVRDALIGASKAVLRPRLTKVGTPARAIAVDLAAPLPKGWVDEQWQHDVVAVAQELATSNETHERRAAVRPLYRLTSDGGDRLWALFLREPDEALQSFIRNIMGEAFNPYLMAAL